ncbi:MAG: hypothetical protein M1823_003644 [Watsoniomyces obsoletus]|nr:MAG: hypothetical protein M1823_003644 [Watsoniomyces obsoletus]
MMEMEPSLGPPAGMYITPMELYGETFGKAPPSWSHISVRPVLQRAQTAPPATQREPNELTPSISDENDDHERISSLPSLLRPSPAARHFLRAFCSFEPEESSSTTITLSLLEGDLIMVHSVHTNGWADGTRLASGARGWLPTNYCDVYEPEAIKTLLDALREIWARLRTEDATQGRFEPDETFVRGMIEGVRWLLEQCNCLTRDCPPVKANERLRRTRRALLADLSALVKLTKRLPDAATKDDQPFTSSRAVDAIDEMTLKAYRVVMRGVRFLDLSSTAEHGVDRMEAQPSSDALYPESSTVAWPIPVVAPAPAPPPSECPSSWELVQPEEENNELGGGSIIITDDASAAPSASELVSCDVVDMVDVELSQQQPPVPIATRQQHSFATTTTTDAHPTTSSSPHSFAVEADSCINSDPSLSHTSSSSHPSFSSPINSSLIAPFPISPSDRSGATETTVTQPSRWVSQRLTSAYDTFLSRQGSFIGRLHLPARLPADLLLATQQSVVACRDLLRVIETVAERDPMPSNDLDQTKNAMCGKMADLVQATKEMLRPRPGTEFDEGGLMTADDSQALMCAATHCVRAAGECVAKGRFVIDRIGDFALEPMGIDVAEIMSGLRTPPEPTLEESDETTLVARFPPPPSSPVNTNHHVEERPVSEDHSAPPLPSPMSIDTHLPPTDTTPSAHPAPRPRSSMYSFASSPIASSFASSPTEVVFSGSKEPTPIVTTNVATATHPADDFDVGSAGTNNASFTSSFHASEVSAESRTSTRATSPDDLCSPSLVAAWARASPGHSNQAVAAADSNNSNNVNVDRHIPDTSYFHELLINKDGQVAGGTLPALVERLTMHDSTADSAFVAAFYLTFRLFTTAVDFSEALIARFEYIGHRPDVAGAVRLRVYNMFKGWLESHWRKQQDSAALPIIVAFATERLPQVLPSAGLRLGELALKASAASGPLVPRLLSSLGKASTRTTSQQAVPTSSLPTPALSRSQLAALRNWKNGGGVSPSLLDLDPLELARQLTIRESKVFCAILPDELLAQEWTRKSGSTAVNVRAMSSFSTDLTTLVAETILSVVDVKKRATVIKHWVKVARRCLDLNNYDSLMAIVCALDSSNILRLKKTWETLSQKTKARLEHLRGVVEVSRNYAVLRQHLQNAVPPCLPFVGIYLTDLTFVDVGNASTRHLPCRDSNDPNIPSEPRKSVINFDKHLKTAKIIGELQRFQVPYRLAEIDEVQDWIESQMKQVRTSNQTDLQNHYRRSLLLEPREVTTQHQYSHHHHSSSTATQHHYHHQQQQYSHHQTTPSESSFLGGNGGIGPGMGMGMTMGSGMGLSVPMAPSGSNQGSAPTMSNASSTTNLRDLFAWASNSKEKLGNNNHNNNNPPHMI